MFYKCQSRQRKKDTRLEKDYSVTSEEMDLWIWLDINLVERQFQFYNEICAQYIPSGFVIFNTCWVGEVIEKPIWQILIWEDTVFPSLYKRMNTKSDDDDDNRAPTWIEPEALRLWIGPCSKWFAAPRQPHRSSSLSLSLSRVSLPGYSEIRTSGCRSELCRKVSTHKSFQDARKSHLGSYYETWLLAYF